jgi:hydrogenase nickel incorporation protein HypA/HybF
MHEYSLMERVIETIEERIAAGGIDPAAIRQVFLKVGVMELHSPDAFRQAFKVQIAGRPYREAELRMEVIPAQLDCPRCGLRRDIGADQVDPHEPYPIMECPKCGHICPVEGGRGVEAIELELEETSTSR